ncbi:MAG: hypothetical protein HRU20_16960 [Pseudomonadales bacterium]|nr:hypothetical protein [Pseudomonadales bacterium]
MKKLKFNMSAAAAAVASAFLFAACVPEEELPAPPVKELTVVTSTDEGQGVTEQTAVYDQYGMPLSITGIEPGTYTIEVDADGNLTKGTMVEPQTDTSETPPIEFNQTMVINALKGEMSSVTMDLDGDGMAEMTTNFAAGNVIDSMEMISEMPDDHDDDPQTPDVQVPVKFFLTFTDGKQTSTSIDNNYDSNASPSIDSVQTYFYDAKGNLTSSEYDDDNDPQTPAQPGQSYSYTYFSGTDNIETKTDNNNTQVWTFTYNSNNDVLTEVSDLQGAISTFTYTDNFKVASETNHLNNKETSYTYNANGRLSQEEVKDLDTNGIISTTTFSYSGNLAVYDKLETIQVTFNLVF